MNKPKILIIILTYEQQISIQVTEIINGNHFYSKEQNMNKKLTNSYSAENTELMIKELLNSFQQVSNTKGNPQLTLLHLDHLCTLIF